jgi:hypothetical protein
MAAGPILDRSALAIDGRDLIETLGVAPGPEVGRILGLLFDRVVDDLSLNERRRLLALATELAATPSDVAGAPSRPPEPPRP